jgi:hypothetical protein
VGNTKAMILYILGWLTGGAISYFLMKRLDTFSYGGWTKGKRNFGIATSLLFGPVNVLVAFIFMAIESDIFSSDKPSKW